MNEYNAIINDYQLSNMRLSEELQYWKAEADKWRSYATQLYNHSYSAILALGDVMLEWDNITQHG